MCCSCRNPAGAPMLFFEIPPPAPRLARFGFRLNFAPTDGPWLSSPRPPRRDEIWRESRRPAVRIRPAAVEGVKSGELWGWPWPWWP